MFGLFSFRQAEKSSAWVKNRRHNSYRGEAVVSQEICPRRKGRVKFRGSWWFARCHQNVTLGVGEVVEVIGLDTTQVVLLVQPSLD